MQHLYLLNLSIAKYKTFVSVIYPYFKLCNICKSHTSVFQSIKYLYLSTFLFQAMQYLYLSIFPIPNHKIFVCLKHPYFKLCNISISTPSLIQTIRYLFLSNFLISSTVILISQPSTIKI